MADAYPLSAFDTPETEAEPFRESYRMTLDRLKRNTIRWEATRAADIITAIEKTQTDPRNPMPKTVARAAGALTAIWAFAKEQPGGLQKMIMEAVLDKTTFMLDQLDPLAPEVQEQYFKNSVAVWLEMEGLVASLALQGFKGDVVSNARFLVNRLPYVYVGRALEAYAKEQAAEAGRRAKHALLKAPDTATETPPRKTAPVLDRDHYQTLCDDACAAMLKTLEAKTGDELVSTLENAATVPAAPNQGVGLSDIAEAAGIFNALGNYYEARADTLEARAAEALYKNTDAAWATIQTGIYGSKATKLYAGLAEEARSSLETFKALSRGPAPGEPTRADPQHPGVNVQPGP